MCGWKQGDMCLAGQESRDCLILFLTSGFAALICLWLLVLPNSNNLINHVLYSLIKIGSQNEKSGSACVLPGHFGIQAAGVGIDKPYAC